ncbi:MAG: oligosaccharide flippase family protein [Kofleriaceae bacterium]
MTQRRRSLLFNSAAYIAGQFASKAVAFIMIIVYARFMDPDDFAITGTLAAYGSVLGAIFVMGLHGSATRHYFDLKGDPAKLRSYLASVYAFQVVVSLVLCLLLEVFGERLWLWYTSGEIPFSYVRLAIWSTFFTTVVMIPQALYQSEERAASLVGWQTAQSVLALVVGIVFVALMQQRALGILRSQLIASVVFAGLFFVLFARSWGSRELRWDHVKMGLRYGVPLLPHTLGTILMQTVDRIMLEKYAPMADVGFYSIARTLGLVLAMIAGGVNQAWAPHFFRTSTEEPPAEARKKAEVFAALFVALFTGLSLFGALMSPELILILGAKYSPAVPYLIPLVIGNLIGFYYFLPANQLLYVSRTGWFLVATGVATLVSVGLNVTLLSRGGGGIVAAWIFVAGSAIQTGIILVAALFHHKSLLGLRHAVVFVAAVAALVVMTIYDLGIAVRGALLVGNLALAYVLLVRGNLRAVIPGSTPLVT